MIKHQIINKARMNRAKFLPGTEIWAPVRNVAHMFIIGDLTLRPKTNFRAFVEILEMTRIATDQIRRKQVMQIQTSRSNIIHIFSNCECGSPRGATMTILENIIGVKHTLSFFRSLHIALRYTSGNIDSKCLVVSGTNSLILKFRRFEKMARNSSFSVIPAANAIGILHPWKLLCFLGKNCFVAQADPLNWLIVSRWCLLHCLSVNMNEDTRLTEFFVSFIKNATLSTTNPSWMFWMTSFGVNFGA